MSRALTPVAAALLRWASHSRVAPATSREVIADLRAAGVPAVPVLTAADRRDEPGLGRHTRAVLRDLGGLPDDEIDDLEERGVIHCGP